MTTAAEATPTAERYVVLDVVRGVALMGILVMNMPAFTAAGAPDATSHAINHGAEVLRDMVFAGKFNSIFSMLFGLGFTLQLARLQEKTPALASAIYVRRLAWLLGLGLVHAAFFWGGDVLHMYALLGFALLWLRHWSDRALLWLMAACLLGPALSQLVRGVFSSPEALAVAPAAAAASAWTAAEIQAYGHGSMLDVARQSLRSFVTMYTDRQELRHHLGFYAQILTTMVLGMLIGRHGLVPRLPHLMPQVRRVQWWALATGLACTGLYGLGHDIGPEAGAALRALVGTSYVIARLALMAFYVLTLVRLMQDAAWQRRLSPFAAAGRMPLTNYLLQTALCSLLFYGWGFGLWNDVGAAAELLLAPLLFIAIQLPLSVWWLRRFEQGPFEWLWRRATYGRHGPVPRPVAK